MEHIDEPFLHNLMNTWKNCRFVAAGVAVNQQGTHHVTMHPWQEWWDPLFADFGFKVMDRLTKLSREPENSKEDRRGHDWWNTEFTDSIVTHKRIGGKILMNKAFKDVTADTSDEDKAAMYRKLNFNQRIDPAKFLNQDNWNRRG